MNYGFNKIPDSNDVYPAYCMFCFSSCALGKLFFSLSENNNESLYDLNRRKKSHLEKLSTATSGEPRKFQNGKSFRRMIRIISLHNFMIGLTFIRSESRHSPNCIQISSDLRILQDSTIYAAFRRTAREHDTFRLLAVRIIKNAFWYFSFITGFDVDKGTALFKNIFSCHAEWKSAAGAIQNSAKIFSCAAELG